MAAIIDLPLEKIKVACLASQAEIANINAPGQVVISGEKAAVDKAGELCLQAGAKREIELGVSGAFHSSLMFEASGQLKNVLEGTEISPPEVPVISNYTASEQHRAGQIRENLTFQMYSPVKWEESMRYLLGQGVSRFFEFGPGKILKGLMRRIDANAQVWSVEKKEDLLEFMGGQ